MQWITQTGKETGTIAPSPPGSARRTPWYGPMVRNLWFIAATTLLMTNSPKATEMTLDLSKGWRLKPGDEAAWSTPSFDDAGWTPIAVGIPWEHAGFPGMDGFAWYRLRVVVPAEWKTSRNIRDVGCLMLELGAVDDADETWFNGVKVGATGSMPPDYSTAWNEPRVYRVPASVVAWGKENVVAVRVYDGKNDGGIYPGPVLLRAAEERDMLEASSEPARADGVFPVGEDLKMTVKLKNKATQDIGGTLECVWTTDVADKPSVLTCKTETVVVPAGRELSRAFSYRPTGPGFYPVSAVMKLAGNKEIRTRLVLGFDVERIEGPAISTPSGRRDSRNWLRSSPNTRSRGGRTSRPARWIPSSSA